MSVKQREIKPGLEVTKQQILSSRGWSCTELHLRAPVICRRQLGIGVQAEGGVVDVGNRFYCCSKCFEGSWVKRESSACQCAHTCKELPFTPEFSFANHFAMQFPLLPDTFTAAAPSCLPPIISTLLCLHSQPSLEMHSCPQLLLPALFIGGHHALGGTSWHESYARNGAFA